MSASDATISILEWRDEFVTSADNRPSFVSSSMLEHFDNVLPPKLNTAWMEFDDSTALPGQLGNWNNDTLDLQYSGQWVMT